jgi:Sec-independent protein translocase protein TatA
LRNLKRPIWLVVAAIFVASLILTGNQLGRDAQVRAGQTLEEMKRELDRQEAELEDIKRSIEQQRPENSD